MKHPPKKPWDRERHLYVFACTACEKADRSTFRRARAGRLLCRNCRKNAPHPNQMTLA